MILGWFTTQTFQERFKKLSQKSQPGGAKISHLAIFLGHSVFFMYLNTVSISHPTFGVNQLHFISRISVLWSFYQCLARCNEGFSAPSIARFIVWSHFWVMSACACPNLRAPHTINPAHCLQCYECVLLSLFVFWRPSLASSSAGIRDLGLSTHHSSIISCAWFIARQ